MQEKKERNRRIYERHLAGETLYSLSKEYNITTSAIREIFVNEERKEKLKSDPLYVMLDQDERLYNCVYRSNQIVTVEQLLAYPREKMKDMRNVGKVTLVKLQSCIDRYLTTNS